MNDRAMHPTTRNGGHNDDGTQQQQQQREVHWTIKTPCKTAATRVRLRKLRAAHATCAPSHARTLARTVMLSSSTKVMSWYSLAQSCSACCSRISRSWMRIEYCSSAAKSPALSVTIFSTISPSAPTPLREMLAPLSGPLVLLPPSPPPPLPLRLEKSICATSAWNGNPLLHLVSGWYSPRCTRWITRRLQVWMMA